MLEPLKNPPLIEAACEFQFDPDSEWDWTIPGRLFEKIGDEFSERAEVHRLGLTVQEVGREAPPPAVIKSGPDRLHLKRKDGSAIVQVGPRMLGINQRRPYPNWATFRELILRIYKTYREIAGSNGLARIGLRYINEIPKKNMAFASITTVWPTLSGNLDRDISHFFQRYEFKHSKPKGILIHQTGQQLRGNKLVIMLDLDFVAKSVGRIKSESSVAKWLDGAHERVEESFIASLKPDFFDQLKRGRG